IPVQLKAFRTMSEHGPLEVSYTAKGLPRYSIAIWHNNLNKYKIVKGDDQHVVMRKATVAMAQWDEMWAKKKTAMDARDRVEDRKEKAAALTEEAENALAELMGILAQTLGVNDEIDWEALKGSDKFGKPKPRKPSLP